jgi:hypothetical protein
MSVRAVPDSVPYCVKCGKVAVIRPYTGPSLIRFHGSKNSLTKWRLLVAQHVGKECSAVQTVPGPRGLPDFFYCTVELTPAEREVLQKRLWYAEAGMGTNGAGNPFRWNDCVGYDVVKDQKAAGKVRWS